MAGPNADDVAISAFNAKHVKRTVAGPIDVTFTADKEWLVHAKARA